jgi:hypothetical protein
MTCGIVVPVDAEFLEEVILDNVAWLRRADRQQLANDPRFAAAIYRTALNEGIMDNVVFREPVASD